MRVYHILYIAIGFVVFCGIMAYRSEIRLLPTWLIFLCVGIMCIPLLVMVFLVKRELYRRQK